MNEALNARQASFVAMMRKSPDHANRGFDLLSKREDAQDYLGVLRKEGLLDADKNPQPVSVPDQEGFVRIPYWRALDYLETLARRSKEKHDLELGRALLEIVAAISIPTSSGETVVDNYHTFRKFAEIVGLVPIDVVNDSVVDLVPIWLTSKYDRSLAAIAVSDGLLSNLLATDSDEAARQASRILRYLTHFEHGTDEDVFEVKTVVDDFWLKEIFSKHIKLFGSRARGEAAIVLESRLRNVFAARQKPYRSSLWRPAIEDHEQNRGYRKAENIFVEGLRDILLAWTETGDKSVDIYVERLLSDKAFDVLQRIALHVVDEFYDHYRDLLPPRKAINFLADPYRHELYRFLKGHFSDFSDADKALLVDAIRSLDVEGKDDNAARRRAYVQRDWCSAIRDKGYEPADVFFRSLDTRKGLGELSDHPDFLSFFTMRAGPDRSPFTAELLATSAQEGRLVELTSSFKESGSWRDPSEEGLWDTLKEVVSAQPELFVERLDDYVGVSIPLIHTLISGLSRRVQEKAAEPGPTANSRIWKALVSYFENVLADPGFWTATDVDGQNLLPRRSWVLSAMADTLAAGTRSDKTAYPKELLPAGWRVICVLLERCPQIEELELSDLSMQAINTARGRAIEAAVSHALRACRVEKKSGKDHAAVWNELAPVFDAQLALTNGSNYEFSLLMAQYLANLDYLSPEWLEQNFQRIFNRNSFENFRCALAGLAYTSLTSRVYLLLVQHDVIGAALDTEYQKRQEGERIVEFMCLALLWGDEDLESARFSKLFESDREAELMTATDWFWSVHDTKMSERRKRLVRRFWAKALDWSSRRKAPPVRLFSKLCRLGGYVDKLDRNSTDLLKAVAPYAGHDFNISELIKEIVRLTPTSPQNAALLTETMLSSSRPYHDYRGELRSLLRVLADHGQREAVFRVLDALTKTDPSMVEFYNDLSAN